MSCDSGAAGNFVLELSARESRSGRDRPRAHRPADGRRARDRCCYTVIRNCIPNARVIRITVAKVGLPSSDSAL